MIIYCFYFCFLMSFNDSKHNLNLLINILRDPHIFIFVDAKHRIIFMIIFNVFDAKYCSTFLHWSHYLLFSLLSSGCLCLRKTVLSSTVLCAHRNSTRTFLPSTSAVLQFWLDRPGRALRVESPENQLQLSVFETSQGEAQNQLSLEK